MLTAGFLLVPFVWICSVLSMCGAIERFFTVVPEKKTASGSAKSEAGK